MDAASSSLDTSFFHIRYPRGDCQVNNPLSAPYRDTKHEADKAVPVQVIGTIMGGMVEKF